MAKKVSNQITFIEQRKITEIKEWYLATNAGSGVTRETSGWTESIQSIDETKKYIWNYEEIVYSLGPSDVTDPVIIGTYGNSGADLQVKYLQCKISDGPPKITNNNVAGWSDTMPTYQEGYYVYMIQKLSNEENWSDPIQISGEVAPTVSIDETTGEWLIDGETTGVKAEGTMPELTISEDGTWVINGNDTQQRAEGPAGKDGSNIEYVYYLSSTEKTSLAAPKYENGTLSSGWTQSPQGITATNKYEYVSVRTKEAGATNWSDFSTPSLWSKWGDRGQDGDGISYEYYLSKTINDDLEYDSSDTKWTDDPSGVSEEYQYEYVVQIKTTVQDGKATTIISKPAIWAKWGATGSSLQLKYINSQLMPEIKNNDVSGWSDTVPPPEKDKKTYMTQKLSTETNWSQPIQISGVDGAANVSIDEDGYWIINGEKTDVNASGEAPTVEISDDGYWVLNGDKTTIKAEGEAGKDGADIEYVYYRNNTGTAPSKPSYNSSNTLTTGWTQSPQGITEDNKYEYVSVRTKAAGSTTWSYFSTPVVWSKWGEKGQDGDGVEYKYYLSDDSKEPTYDGGSKWTDDPSGVSEEYQYEYVVQIKRKGDGSTEASSVALWAKYGENGTNGRGISDITNYYQVSTTTTAPSTSSAWPTTAPELTPENKYLWNYEVITYTDGNTKSTTPAIIGVYGDSGAEGVTFEIYAPQGTVFKENVTEIALNIAAFKGTTSITGVTYTWSRLDDSSGKYTQVLQTTETNPSITIYSSDSYACSTFKCTMTYDGKTYEDYISLTNETVIYSAVVKFFDGTNVFSSLPYVISYVELYKNNVCVESLQTDQYYVGDVTVSGTTITPKNMTKTYVSGDKVYFVYFDGTKYQVVLGEYKSNKWSVVSNYNQYSYKNDFDTNITSNVVPIYKENINKSKNIRFMAYKKDTTELLCETNATVIDINDPIISDDPPENAKEGQLWLNTSVSPYELYIYTNGNWEYFSQQNGGAVYLSKPSTYYIGDLWVLSAEDAAEANSAGFNFGEGTMLKAINNSNSGFNWADWTDATPSNTATLNNVKQYFRFDADDGLRIGQADEKFYVNIRSTRMSFCENPDITVTETEESIDDNEVVYIGNKSAGIKNLIVEGTSEFNGNSKFNGEIIFGNFVLKQESNNSLSLAIAGT